MPVRKRRVTERSKGRGSEVGAAGETTAARPRGSNTRLATMSVSPRRDKGAAAADNGRTMDRLVIFCAQPSGVPNLLLRATLAALDSRADIEVVALVLGSPTSRIRRMSRRLWLDLAVRVKSWFDPAQRRVRSPAPVDVEREAKRRRFEVIVACDAAGDEALIARLRARHCTLALSYYWPRRLDERLLDRFDVAVNYHNGRLPGCRGLRATAWSVYRGDATSGYAFHRMTPAIDAGPVLVAGEVPTADRASTADLDLAKASAASGHLRDVLRMMAERAPGVPQTGPAGYRSEADAQAIMRIDRPGDLSSDELHRRLRAFGLLRIAIDGESHPVTRLDAVAAGRVADAPLSFRTADGVVMATRLRYLPPVIYRVARPLGLVGD